MNLLVTRARGDTDEYKYRVIFVFVSPLICTLQLVWSSIMKTHTLNFIYPLVHLELI